MIYSVNFLDMTEKINPLAFSKYLKDTGWSLYPNKKTMLRYSKSQIQMANHFK